MGDSDPHRSWRPLVMGRRGAVASNHPLATQAGLSILERGGNAVDAALAVATTIAVVEPQANGVGGDAFYLVWEAESRRATAVQACAPAPAAATLERYASGIPHTGAIAAITPGVADGWQMLLERWASLPAKALYEAAVHYAREGFAASPRLCEAIAESQAALACDRGCSKLFLRDGTAARAGTTLANPALARTLETLASEGARALHGGALGKKLAQFVAVDGGLVTLDDLAAHRALAVEPIRVRYRGYDVLEAPPPSMGFALLLELLIVEEFALSELPLLGADAVHLLVEAKKLAFAERESFAGDPAFVNAPLERLLAPEHARSLARRIDRERAAPSFAVSTLGGDTTYFCVVDARGNAVSGIQSIAGPFGACALDPATGILLNNRMVWFHLDPRHPNALAPRKHVRHTINPPLALLGDSLGCVFGTPGGDAQVQTSLQTFTALVDWRLDPQQAVEAPRWTHFQPGTASLFPHIDPEILLVESRYEPRVLEELARRGHAVSVVGPLENRTAASIIQRDASGLLSCGADPRRDGWAAAF